MSTPGEQLDAALAAVAKATARANTAAERAEATVDTPTPPDVTTPPEKLPERRLSSALSNKSAANIHIARPGHIGILNNRTGLYSYDNLVVSEPGGDPWHHGLYQSRGELELGRAHFLQPRRESPGGRDHLALYISGAEIVTADLLMIGHPDDLHRHEMPIKVKSKVDPDRRVELVYIKTLIAYGGSRVLLNAGNDKKGGSPVPGSIPAAERIVLDRVLWIDPEGSYSDSGQHLGHLDALRFSDCPDVEVGELVILDSRGMVAGDVRLAEIERSTVRGSATVHLPKAASIGGLSFNPRPAPVGQMPKFDMDHAVDLLRWGGLA